MASEDCGAFLLRLCGQDKAKHKWRTTATAIRASALASGVSQNDEGGQSSSGLSPWGVAPRACIQIVPKVFPERPKAIRKSDYSKAIVKQFKVLIKHSIPVTTVCDT